MRMKTLAKLNKISIEDKLLISAAGLAIAAACLVTLPLRNIEGRVIGREDTTRAYLMDRGWYSEFRYADYSVLGPDGIVRVVGQEIDLQGKPVGGFFLYDKPLQEGCEYRISTTLLGYIIMNAEQIGECPSPEYKK